MVTSSGGDSVCLPAHFRVNDRASWDQIWTEAFDRLHRASKQHRQQVLAVSQVTADVTWQHQIDKQAFQQLFRRAEPPSPSKEAATLPLSSPQQQHFTATSLTASPKAPSFAALVHANSNDVRKWTPADVEDILQRTQRYLSQLGYNHLGEAFFDITKSAGASRIIVLAKEIMHQGLPIKCLEAVVIATHLTMGVHALDRIPLAFESSAKGNTYRHIVLLVRYRPKPGQSVWGALGLSRRNTLMWKPCRSTSLAALVWDFKESYEAVTHTLMSIRLGLPFTHDETSNQPLPWHVQDIAMKEMTIGRMHDILETYVRRLR